MVDLDDELEALLRSILLSAKRVQVKRGDVYWADIMPRSGSEQGGQGPVIILFHDAFNEVPAWRSVIVVPISTSAAQAKRGPTTVYLPKGAGGLEERQCCALPPNHHIGSRENYRADRVSRS